MMGEPVVKGLEETYDVFKTFATKGLDGIWEYLKDKFSDLKEIVIDAIKDMLITQVIQAGIKWLLSLLIPGAGFIKAIMAIKDLIVFFVESAMMLIPAITEAILALAAGSVAGVAIAIEKGLAKLIGLVIGLFAKLIGLGGLSKKVTKIFKNIRKRVDRQITKILQTAKRKARGMLRSKGSKNKPTNPKEHDLQVKAGLSYLDQMSSQEDKDNDKQIDEQGAKRIASKTKNKFKVFTSITPRLEGEKWVYDWTGSRGTKKTNLKGFKSKGQLDQFAKEVQAGVAKAGYGRSVIMMQGSAVTGIQFKKPNKAFDDGRKSDFDVGIINLGLLEKAQGMGFAKIESMKSFPLDTDNPARARSLGLEDLQIRLSQRMGRDVNFRIYASVSAAKSAGTSQTIKYD